MKRIFNVYFGFFAALLIIVILAFNGGKENPPSQASIVNGPVPNDGLPQVIQSIELKDAYDFAGEYLPLGNFDVRERLEKELIVNSYFHSSTSQNLKKAVRYFPVIERILKEEGLPEDLKYLAVAESNLSNATSPAGAKGFWQFMTPAARQYGLEVNSQVDERFHLEKATRAACKYFKYLHKRFGNWTMAAAAYNVGPTKFAREKDLQQMDSYYDMNLNAETSRYIFRVVAIKEVLSKPKEFGFYIEKEDGFPPLIDYQVVEINSAVSNWGAFAKEKGTTYRMIKLYNPWLISHQLTNSAKKTYQIKIPK